MRITSVICVALALSPILFAQGQRGAVIQIGPSVGTAIATAPARGVIQNNSPGPAANNVIVPAAQATAFGNTSNVIPFTWTPTHYMQIFHASDFAAKPHLMFSLGLRQDDQFSGINGAVADIEIWLGYTKNNRNTLVSTYASNWNSGPPIRVLPRTSICIPKMPASLPTNPHTFFFRIFFKVPFNYDPSKGNLLIEIKQHAQSKGPAFYLFPLDAQSNSLTTSRVFSSHDANARTGTLNAGIGLVMEFGSKSGTNCNKVLATATPFGQGCRGTGGHAGHIVPAVARSRFLNLQTHITFGSRQQRWQQQINGSQMPTVATQFISMALRDDSVPSTSTSTLMTFKIELGNTARNSQTMTSNFSSNRTSTMTTVFNGKVRLPAVSRGNASVNEFVYVIPFPTPYLFVPNANHPNFLIDIANTTLGSARRFPDAEMGPAAQGSRVYTTGSPTALTGVLNRDHCMAICFGTKGAGNARPYHIPIGRPVINRSFSFDLGAARPRSGAALILGVSNTNWGLFKLPLPLAGLGATGCNLHVSVDLMLLIATTAAGTASLPLELPNLRALVGLSFFSQYLVLDPSANAAGFVMSNGLGLKIGDA